MSSSNRIFFPSATRSLSDSVNILIVAQALAHSKLPVTISEDSPPGIPATNLPYFITDSNVPLFTPIAIVCYLLGDESLDALKLEESPLIDLLANYALSRQSDCINNLGKFGTPSDTYSKFHLAALCKLIKSDAGLWKWICEKSSELTTWYDLVEPEIERAARLLPNISFLGIKRQNLTEDLHQFHYDWSIKRLPKEGERNILITSALPYVNNVPHLGNIIGAVLSGDVYARYCRLRGYNVIYMCGTDEYGTATETKALEEGTSCEDVCTKYFKQHSTIYDWFQIKFDLFGRTSTPIHTKITHQVFHSLYENGFFFEQGVEQTFCEKCNRFLADRYVEGTCPLCNFPDARGDQCDGCGKLINPIELKNPKCKICKSTPIVKSSNHLFLDLTKLQERTSEFVDESSVRGNWTGNAAAIAKGWLHDGLKARCMTRDLKWGCSVPLESMKNKVFYVWFDAPIGYLSITANYCGPENDNWKLWWMNPKNVELYQFMGKDNVPFHTIIFPATLIGTGQPYTLLHHINTTEYLNYESGKFSKSRGTGVFGNDAKDCGIPPAMWRYYLLSTRPETSDAIFSWDDFAQKINSELISNLGNFVNRTTKFISAKLGGTVGLAALNEEDGEFFGKVNLLLKEYFEHMEAVKIKSGLKVVMSISSLGNQYITENKLDGKLLLSDPARCNTVLSVAASLIYLLGIIIEPFLPSTSADICSILNAPLLNLVDDFKFAILLKEGHELGTPFHLFQPLDLNFISELKIKYAGKQQKH